MAKAYRILRCSEVRGVHIQFTAARYSWSRKRGHVNYDPLVELIHIAEGCCADHGRLSKAAALQDLQTVLRANPELCEL